MKPPSDDAVQRALEDEQEQEEQGGRAESAPEDREGQRQAQPRPGGQDIVNDEYVRTGKTEYVTEGKNGETGRTGSYHQ